MIDWNDYNYFALIADEGSYSRAALRAGVSKSVLSRRMAALEERLGVRLIQRTTRRLALTAAGEQFAVECRALVAQGERARAVVMAAQKAHRECCASARRYLWLKHGLVSSSVNLSPAGPGEGATAGN